MIISNEKKFIYLRVPKTGSTSVSVYLYENLPLEKNIIRISDRSPFLKKTAVQTIKDGYFEDYGIDLDHGVHATLDDILKLNLLKYPISEYEIYAVCRNPVERYISFQNMIKTVEGIDILENFTVFKKYMSIFECNPQSLWLNHNNKLVNRVFLYEDIDKLVSSIAEKYNIYDTSSFSEYSYRTYKKHTDKISAKALDFINAYWHDDFVIYETLKKQKF